METILKSIKTFLLAMVNNGTLKPKCKYCGCILDKDDEETCFKNPANKG